MNLKATTRCDMHEPRDRWARVIVVSRGPNLCSCSWKSSMSMRSSRRRHRSAPPRECIGSVRLQPGPQDRARLRVRLKPDTPEITVAPGCWSRRLGEHVLESYRYSVERSIGVCGDGRLPDCEGGGSCRSSS